VFNYQEFSASIEKQFRNLFSDLEKSGLAAREDSRAFGAMIEKYIIDSWEAICRNVGAGCLPPHGRRTIHDVACTLRGTFIGFDIKTKDLDKIRYSDGGVCAVGNLLKFLANDNGVFTVVEFGHDKAVEGKDLPDLEYIKIAPFHLLPEDTYRIENLGTGQVRLDYSIRQIYDKIQWDRPLNGFFDIFTEIAIKHYERVSRDALKYAEAICRFRQNGYVHFSFS
jgi:hypothetical protein